MFLNGWYVQKFQKMFKELFMIDYFITLLK